MFQYRPLARRQASGLRDRYALGREYSNQRGMTEIAALSPFKGVRSRPRLCENS